MENPSLPETAMSAQPAIERTVVLHVGMHKTASTYIQACLRKNLQLLHQEGFITPGSRKENTALVRSLVSGTMDHWTEWLESAAKTGRQLLISHEAFSLTLCKPGTGMNIKSGLWLAEQLKSMGWRLRIISFIRCQESYLNSRYTQLAKRLRVDCDFETYAMKVMRGGTISECNLMTLFGWVREDTSIRFSMIPFDSARDQHGQSLQHKPDPFEQLVSELDLPSATIARTRRANVLNQQPGRLGVNLARDVCQFMQQRQPAELKAQRKRLRAAIEKLALKNEWHREPFNGLTTKLCQDIREHYRESNQMFCQSFWPNQQWERIFPDIQRTKPPRDSKDNEDTLRALRNNVIASTIPSASTVQ